MSGIREPSLRKSPRLKKMAVTLRAQSSNKPNYRTCLRKEMMKKSSLLSMSQLAVKAQRDLNRKLMTPRSYKKLRMAPTLTS
jgi:hypothetical protein